jgi:uncharacterized protein (DUF952 family)
MPQPRVSWGFKDGETEYFPVCLPAFRPDRCIREDDSQRSEDVSAKLQELHASGPAAASPGEEAKPEVLYHMCLKADWEAAKASGDAYYPPTFAQDGNYTHATAVADRLVQTANHFYQDSTGDWICLRMSRAALKRCGIFTKDEQALPVGDKAVGATWGAWVCPHVYGGLPISVVDGEFRIIREGPKFISIEF